jgi:hypothetical protein
MTVQDELSQAVSMAYDRRRTETKVSPTAIATEAMKIIRFPADLHPLGYVGCHLHLRQVARGFCRRQFDPLVNDDPDDGRQAFLFEGTLQERYPTMRRQEDDEPEYVLRDHMTDEDIEYNAARLEARGNALLRHAQALRLFGRQRGHGFN